MSAVTLAVLRDARAKAQRPASTAAFAYRDALSKAPTPIAAAHFLGLAWHFLIKAVRVLTGRTR